MSIDLTQRNPLKPALLIAVLFAVGLAGCERPPQQAKQIGYRGLGMEQVTNPRTEKAKLAAIKIPDVQPAADTGGPKASTIYKSLKVLGDLSEGELIRTMAAMTEWVSPEEGCAYCHNVENLADESKYTHTVSRRMLQMTRHINETWKPHVGQTGVTCYTCHAGKPVPKNIWFSAKDPTAPWRMTGYTAGNQNRANRNIGSTSMTADPFTDLIGGGNTQIRIASTRALPLDTNVPGKTTPTIQDTEKTYALMIHMSESLGVNCTFCHNSRAFGSWTQSTPQRATAWHGLRLVRDINEAFLTPLKPVYPANRLGPHGDAPKAFCSTCHQGLAKPLNGTQMLKDYLELNRASLAPVALAPAK